MIRFCSFRLAWLFAAGAVAIPTAKVAAALTKEFNETYAVGSEHRLVVDAVAVELAVTGTDRSDISLHMVWDAQTDNTETAAERFERLEFLPRSSGEETILQVKTKKSGGGFLFWRKHEKVPTVRMELEVPHHLRLALDTTSGEIVLRSVEGNHVVDTTSADVTLEDCVGDHQLETVSGRVTVLGCPGNHHANTTSGSIRIEGGHGDVVADTVSGDVRILDFPGAHRADTVSGDIQATLSSVIDHKLKFDTVSGSVVLLVPADLAAQFELDSVSGSIRFEVPEAEIIKRERHELSARTHGGQERIVLDTVSGDITVRLAEMEG